jgi:hypothetical protein
MASIAHAISAAVASEGDQCVHRPLDRAEFTRHRLIDGA